MSSLLFLPSKIREENPLENLEGISQMRVLLFWKTSSMTIRRKGQREGFFAIEDLSRAYGNDRCSSNALDVPCQTIWN